MAKCTECGAAVADDSKFCNYCGAKLNIVSEHLGAQILGNTQVIMAALERIAPGAAQQYTVVGTATDGPMAGGLVLQLTVGSKQTFWWSDGHKLTEVAQRHIHDCFERGSLAFSSDLLVTCPNCLTTYHASRSAWEHEWRMWYGRNALASQFLAHHQSPGGTWMPWWGACPICCANRLASETYLADRVEFLVRDMSSFQLEKAALDAEVLHFRSPRKYKRQAAAWRDFVRGKMPVLDRLRSIVPRTEASEQEAFRAFSETVPDLARTSTRSPEEWLSYQRPFRSVADFWYVQGHFTPPGLDEEWLSFGFDITPAMERDVEAAALIDRLLGGPPKW